MQVRERETDRDKDRDNERKDEIGKSNHLPGHDMQLDQQEPLRFCSETERERDKARKEAMKTRMKVEKTITCPDMICSLISRPL